MNDVINFNLVLEEEPEFVLTVQDGEGIPFTLETEIKVVKVAGDTYDGDYTITPSSETQVLETKDLVSTDNFTINPIPSNYGLITWNGTTLIVS